jgi:hypothetical protein
MQGAYVGGNLLEATDFLADSRFDFFLGSHGDPCVSLKVFD